MERDKQVMWAESASNKLYTSQVKTEVGNVVTHELILRVSTYLHLCATWTIQELNIAQSLGATGEAQARINYRGERVAEK